MSLPLIKIIDWPQGARAAARRFLGQRHLVVLESSQLDPARGRYSIIGFDPFAFFAHKGPDTLAKLKEAMAPFAGGPADFSLPFGAGAMGYLSYDFGLHHEPIRLKSVDDLRLPDAAFGLYDCLLVVDHFESKLHIVSTGLPETDGAARLNRARKRLGEIAGKLAEAFSGPPLAPVDSNPGTEQGLGAPSMSREEYLCAVRKALDYIAAGDIYQVNFSQRFCWPLPSQDIAAFDIYDTLTTISPAPFGCFFDAGDHCVISNSPERFLKLRGRNIETRPMKGTRARGADIREDSALRREIEESAKDKAELLMITDLERNDLGRVCEFGSVKVRDLRTIEEYNTVFQATSTVEGVLKKGNDAFDALAACFPGGSITGCPKIRAMEIIEELEPSRRGVYTGSFGHIGFNGDMDFNILIRTLLCRDGKIYFQAGGGIVADSDPQKEYEETLIKARAIRLSLAALQAKYPSKAGGK